jgi:hypothetical protein
MQLDLWGLEYFDLFLVHFPIALEYVDPNHRYPPEWWGDDKKSVNLRTFQLSLLSPPLKSVALIYVSRKHAIPGNVGRYGRIDRRRTREEYRRQVGT